MKLIKVDDQYDKQIRIALDMSVLQSENGESDASAQADSNSVQEINFAKESSESNVEEIDSDCEIDEDANSH